ncbi:MAG: prolyl oligopeptidase family serine peptidase [Chitinophagaceae bacterium]
MKKTTLLCTLLSATVVAHAQYNYPATKTVDSADTYWGVTVPDPYRWLEDLKNPEVETWFKTQAEYTNAQLAKIPGQDKLIQEQRDLDKVISVKYHNMSKGGINFLTKAGGRYFYEKRLAGEQVYKLYCRQGESGKENLLFDPQKYIGGKTMNYEVAFSSDGSRVLLTLSEAGSEIGDMRVVDAATGKLLPDSIPHSGWGQFAGGSNAEITYQELKSYDVHDPEIILNTPNKLHVIGTPISSDIVLASAKKNPELNILPNELPMVSGFKNSPYIILGKYTVENFQTFYYASKSELKNDKINWKPLTVKDDEVLNVFLNGSDIYLLTSKGNSKIKIIKTSLRNPDLKTAETIAEGSGDWKLSTDFITQAKDYLIISKSKNGVVYKSYTYEFKTGKLSEINVPLTGSTYAQSISNDENEVVLLNSGWNIPYNYHGYDLQTKKFFDGPIHMTFHYPNLENIVYEEVEVPSHDGALVPLSIVYDKARLKKDGSNIAFMEGYGAYGKTPFLPIFYTYYLPLLNCGVVLAFAHVRGGGEKGNDWYLAGKKTTKPNTWKDFNACAEWLIKNKYTSSEKLGAEAASAGGILIGRAITERPDLYKAAIAKVGNLNALRGEFTPNGPSNIPEFGTVKDSIGFRALLEMDAYQHTQKGVKYPAQLITTGWNDPRVDSYIPAKFAAKMQAENGSQNPVFLYVDYGAGHFGGSTLDEQYVQMAREYAFLLWQCGDKELLQVTGIKLKPIRFSNFNTIMKFNIDQ